MKHSFVPKSKDNPPKCFQQLPDIGNISRRVIRARPISDYFQSVTAPKEGRLGNP